MRRLNPLHATALGAFALLAACSTDSNKAADTTPAVDTSAPAAAAAPTAERSLYDRLGGKEAITVVIDDFVANVAADKTINARFAKTDIPHLKQLLVEQVCQATGGPCTYTGKSMKEAHKGMKITEAEFNALVADLTQSLDKHNVGATEKKELLTALGSMKGDIVGG